MATKNKLTQVSVKIGKALGKAEKQAHHRARQFDQATKVTKEELREISKKVDALKKQLAKTTQRLAKVLSS
ncbi:MAG: hypothetical protein WBL63_18490 [Candidatus Acidiferrum sp.]